MVEIGGLCSLQFFICSQFATAMLTTTFASRIETAEPLIDTCSNEFSISFFSLFLSCVLILLKGLCQPWHMHSTVHFRLICIRLVMGFFCFPHVSGAQYFIGCTPCYTVLSKSNASEMCKFCSLFP